MSHEALGNLLRIGQLKSEPFDALEFDRLLKMAQSRLAGAQIVDLFNEGRFTSAYSAAHAAALAALRWHGYRSENRFTVFQCLAHTLGWPPHKWRVLDAAHQKRNLAEYEGYWDIEESAIAEISSLLPELIATTQKLKTHNG
jgi:hypothetical protein